MLFCVFVCLFLLVYVILDSISISNFQAIVKAVNYGLNFMFLCKIYKVKKTNLKASRPRCSIGSRVSLRIWCGLKATWGSSGEGIKSKGNFRFL